MRGSLVGAAFFALLSVALGPQGKAVSLPTKIGACSEATITEIGYRLGDIDRGSAISYANGRV